jgi:hypothetical protein
MLYRFHYMAWGHLPQIFGMKWINGNYCNLHGCCYYKYSPTQCFDRLIYIPFRATLHPEQVTATSLQHRLRLILT